MELLAKLREEKSSRMSGGLYHQTQVRFAYNSNRIEGSKLSEEQTRYIYETDTVFVENGEQTLNVDDILETVNHFACFDYLLDIADEPLTEQHIKKFHALLKANTSDAKKSWFRIGEYKLRPNVVGNIETTAPAKVEASIRTLLKAYHTKKIKTLDDIVEFHFQFESIHPFQDGNGRVGRLIMFKECLANNIIPFIIEDNHKFFYYRGLAEFPHVKEFLRDTCLSAQDNYKALLDYFFPQ